MSVADLRETKAREIERRIESARQDTERRSAVEPLLPTDSLEIPREVSKASAAEVAASGAPAPGSEGPSAEAGRRAAIDQKLSAIHEAHSKFKAGNYTDAMEHLQGEFFSRERSGNEAAGAMVSGAPSNNGAGGRNLKAEDRPPLQGLPIPRAGEVSRPVGGSGVVDCSLPTRTPPAKAHFTRTRAMMANGRGSMANRPGASRGGVTAAAGSHVIGGGQSGEALAVTSKTTKAFASAAGGRRQAGAYSEKYKSMLLEDEKQKHKEEEPAAPKNPRRFDRSRRQDPFMDASVKAVSATAWKQPGTISDEASRDLLKSYHKAVGGRDGKKSVERKMKQTHERDHPEQAAPGRAGPSEPSPTQYSQPQNLQNGSAANLGSRPAEPPVATLAGVTMKTAEENGWFAARYAKESFEKGNLVDCIKYASEAINSVETSAETHFIRAESFRMTGCMDKALADYTKALALDPTQSHFYYGRGLCHAGMADHGAALTEFTKALSLQSPPAAEVYINLGICKQVQGDHVAALMDFTRAIEVQPDNAYGYFCRGELYELLGDDENARDDYDMTMRRNPDFHLPYLAQAKQAEATGNQPKALAIYRTILKLVGSDMAPVGGTRSVVPAPGNSSIECRPDLEDEAYKRLAAEMADPGQPFALASNVETKFQSGRHALSSAVGANRMM